MSDWFWRLLGWRKVTVVVRSVRSLRQRPPVSRWTRGDVTVVCRIDGHLESIGCGVTFVYVPEKERV